MFCNHGLADTSGWLLLWPWDPKLDNFRIGEHTFSEGAGGLKPKTVYRSTFNIGKESNVRHSAAPKRVPAPLAAQQRVLWRPAGRFPGDFLSVSESNVRH